MEWLFLISLVLHLFRLICLCCKGNATWCETELNCPEKWSGVFALPSPEPMNGLKMGWSSHIICVWSDEPHPFEMMNMINTQSFDCADITDSQTFRCVTATDTQVLVALTQPKVENRLCQRNQNLPDITNATDSWGIDEVFNRPRNPKVRYYKIFNTSP